MPGVQGDAVAVKRQIGLHLIPHRPAQHPRAHQREPARHGGHIGAGEVFQIALCAVRQIRLRFRHPSGPADIAAKMGHVERDLPTPGDNLPGRAAQPHQLHIAGRKGAVAIQRQPTDLRPGISLKIRHPFAQAKCNPAHSSGGHVVGKLQPGDFGRGHTGPQAMAGMHEHIGGIADTLRPCPQQIGDNGRQFDGIGRAVHLGRSVIFPTDCPHSIRRRDLGRNQIGQAQPTAAGLGNQRQAGAQHRDNRARLNQWRNRRVRQAFIARRQGRILGSDNQQRLFKARIKPGRP